MSKRPHHKSVWSSAVFVLIVLMAFTAAIALAAPALSKRLSGVPLELLEVLLAIVPGVGWLAFFYDQERREPEPKLYVAGLFLLGFALAGMVAEPLINRVFAVRSWMYGSTAAMLAASVLVIGATQEFLKFVAVRYTVYDSPEHFDKPLDGVIYATAAGLGFATFLNLHYVLGNGGVDLSVGMVHMTVTAFAQASFAGLLGAFLGHAKFTKGSDTPLLVSGIAVAAVMNGLFHVALGKVDSQGLTYNPWNGLILATLVVGAVFAVLVWLMRKEREEETHELVPDTKHYYLREDGPMIALVIVLLLCGAAVRHNRLNRTVRYSAVGVSVALPTGWFEEREDSTVLDVRDPTSGSTFATQLVVDRAPLAQGDQKQSLSDLALRRTVQASRTLPFFDLLATSSTNVANHRAVHLQYVYVVAPGGSGVLNRDLPVVVRADEYLLMDGHDLVTLRYAADNALYGRQGGPLERIIETVQLNNAGKGA